MRSIKTTFIAATMAIAAVGSASAATLQATDLTVNIYRSANNTGNADNSADAIIGNLTPARYLGTISYTGAIDFNTQTQNADTSTIDEWLTSGGTPGSYSVISPVFDTDLTMSNPSIRNGTATTTWFQFVGASVSPFTFSATHDDGVCFYENGAEEVCSQNPTTVKTTNGFSYDGGVFSFLYAATNGDPSVLKLTSDVTRTLTPVPVPAAGFLLLGGLGGLAMLRRRRKS